MLDYPVKNMFRLTNEGLPNTASERICKAFLELLERQFPIIDHHVMLKIRTPSHFAQLLHVHVNHLNRVVKSVLHKPTSVVIRERILMESMRLLEHTEWSISEIAYALGFTEVTHFNSFFKRKTTLNPTQFRKSSIIHKDT